LVLQKNSTLRNDYSALQPDHSKINIRQCFEQDFKQISSEVNSGLIKYGLIAG